MCIYIEIYVSSDKMILNMGFVFQRPIRGNDVGIETNFVARSPLANASK